MDPSLTNTNLDGNTTTTPAEPGTSNEGHVMETSDRQSLTTMAHEEQIVTTDDGQTEAMTLREVIDVIGGDPAVADEQPMFSTAVEEVSMMVDVDPLACPMSAYLSADEAVLSPSSGTPLKSISITPVTPHREFLSMEENTPDITGSGGDINLARKSNTDGDLDIGPRKRVVGRKLAVVEDEGETQSSKSDASADEEALTTASSSRARRKGIKRGRGKEKDKEWKYGRKTEEESSEEKRKKKKGKKRAVGKKDTPEELSDGKCGEPKGIVELVLEDLSSSVLGGAIAEWADRVEEIRAKCRNIHGRLSGEMKRKVSKIKEGTALLVARAEATGDPDFLRMRNSELTTRIREKENEIARLKEQLRKASLGPSPPRRKRRVEKVESEVNVPQTAPEVLTSPKRSVAAKAPMREEFPPLEQRPPRVVTARSGSARVPALMPDFSTAVCDSGTETGAEAYFTRHINFLIAARDMERQRREQQGREQMGLRKERKKENRNMDGRGDAQEETRKVGPRVISDVQVAPPFMSRPKEGAAVSTMSGSDMEWKVVGSRRKHGGGNVSDKSLPPLNLLLLGVRIVLLRDGM